ncbi:hypothetical protein [Pedobacter sp. UBA5917]|jgi:hypothetical protein|uniref:hypothetical protein n=1 Tax=Pedobacter sp. UBA5917 TaxID=1947061 RepID=UPI0025D354DF|nr:hypothetical protein [Pedobacter sp. UBA5917]
MAIFSDLSSNFQLIDYSPTHGQLLIRCLKNKQRDYNIDIIFKGVLHILIPVVFNGIEIAAAEINEDNGYLVANYGFKISGDYRIFSITDTKSKIYYLNAMCFGVYHNKLDSLETSIGRYDMDSLGENILWYAD